MPQVYFTFRKFFRHRLKRKQRWQCLYNAKDRRPYWISNISKRVKKKILSRAPLGTFVGSLCLKVLMDTNKEIPFVFLPLSDKYPLIKISYCKLPEINELLFIFLPLGVICPALLFVCQLRSRWHSQTRPETWLCGCCERRCIWPVISMPSCQSWQQQQRKQLQQHISIVDPWHSGQRYSAREPDCWKNAWESLRREDSWWLQQVTMPLRLPEFELRWEQSSCLLGFVFVWVRVSLKIAERENESKFG